MSTAIGATPISKDEWHCLAFSYDGEYGRVYLNGALDQREHYNPYHYSSGLFDGGEHGSDFTVAAVHRSNEMGNFFSGAIGGLAIFNEALSEVELSQLSSL